MKPSFSVDLDCRARLFVDCTDSKSRRLQETTTVFFAALVGHVLGFFLGAAHALLSQPSSTLSLEALHRRTTELEEMDYQRFNSRPGKNSLFHCLYSARRHLLDCPASQQGQSALARISDKLDTVALLRATDFLVKRQRGECIELLRRALELCRTTTVKQSGTPQEGRCDDTESEETAITRTSSLSLSDIGVDLARPTDSLRASAAAGNV